MRRAESRLIRTLCVVSATMLSAPSIASRRSLLLAAGYASSSSSSSSTRRGGLSRARRRHAVIKPPETSLLSKGHSEEDNENRRSKKRDSPIIITSTANDVVKLARQLHKRKGREAHGLVLLEGRRLIADALAAGCAPHALLVADDDTLDDADDKTLAALCGSDLDRVLRATPRVVAACCDTTSPQGAVALARPPSVAVPKNPDLVLALDAVSDPGNAGALVRTAAAAGFDAVVFVGAQSADPLSPKALRAAMGATFRVPLVRAESWDDALQTLRDAWRLRVCVADAPGSTSDDDDDDGDVPTRHKTRQPSLAHDAIDWTRPSAVVVGAEVGVSTSLSRALDDADRCGDDRLRRVHIPIDARVESLNAAVAGSVIMLEARRQRRHQTAANGGGGKSRVV